MEELSAVESETPPVMEDAEDVATWSTYPRIKEVNMFEARLHEGRGCEELNETLML